MNDKFEELLQALYDEAGAKLYRARLALCCEREYGQDKPFHDAVEILFWAEYRVKSNIS